MMVELDRRLIRAGGNACLLSQVTHQAVLVRQRNPGRIEEELRDCIDPVRRYDIAGEGVADVSAGIVRIRARGGRIEDLARELRQVSSPHLRRWNGPGGSLTLPQLKPFVRYEPERSVPAAIEFRNRQRAARVGAELVAF